MKRILALLGMTAVMVAPLSAQITPVPTGTSANGIHGRAKALRSATVAPTAKRDRIVYYITDRYATGSHIPLVVVRYHGDQYTMFGASHSSKYGTEAIATSGSLSVGGALNTLDPAISSVGINR